MEEFGSHIFENLRKGIEKSMTRLPVIIGKETVSFIKGNFDAQGYRGDSFQPWKPLKYPNPGQLILRSGKPVGLYKAIMVMARDADSVTVGVDGEAIPYAQLHNEGGVTHPKVTPKLRKWAWAMYYKTLGIPKKSKSAKKKKPAKVKRYKTRHETKMTVKANMYKAIALTKKERLTVNIPKRQFMPIGTERSQMLADYLIGHIEKELKRNIKL